MSAKINGLDVALSSVVTGYGRRWSCKMTRADGEVILDAHDFASRSHAFNFARQYAYLIAEGFA